MSKIKFSPVGGAITAMAALSLVLGGCGASAEEPAGAAAAELEIAVEHPDRDTLTYQVGCIGDDATITGDAVDVVEQAACAALSQPGVVERLVNGPATDQVCTEIYGGPDVATITGTIDGRTVEASIDRVNGCAIGDWDDLLAALLPPAVGVAS